MSSCRNELLYGRAALFSCRHGTAWKRTALWKSCSARALADMELLSGKLLFCLLRLLYGRAALLALADMELLYSIFWLLQELYGRAALLALADMELLYGRAALLSLAEMELLYG